MASLNASWMTALVVGCFATSVAVRANPFSTVPEVLEKTFNSFAMIPSTPVEMGFGAHPGLLLSSMDRQVMVRKFLSDHGLHPSLQLVAKPSDSSDLGALGLSGTTGLVVHDYILRAGAYEVCKSSVRSVQLARGGMRILGATPIVDAVYPVSDDAWDSRDDAVTMAAKQLRAEVPRIGDIFFVNASRCVYPLAHELKPAWRVMLKSGITPYLLFVGSEGVLEGDTFAFDATATVRAYDPNPSTGTLKDYSIPVNGDGYMTNEYFTTADGGSSGLGRLQSSTNTFTNGASSGYFAEQSVFAHIYEHFVFATQAGYTWKGPKPLTVKTHVTFSGGEVNNAQYTPFDGASGPFIYVADGDGQKLKNLAFDGDVVSHEFGHHVVFSSITTTSGESLVLHEGLSDAITFMRTGDACLGESICPAGSTICQVANKCLRSGATTMRYKDSTYQSLSGSAHRQSQVVSGLFWDLRQGGAIAVSDLNKLLMTAITLMPSNADVKALITAILDADFAAFGGKYQTVITSAASARGMGIDTLGIDVNAIDGVLSDSSSPSSKSTSKKGFLGLCAVGSASSANGSFGLVLIVLVIPLLASIVNQKKAILVKIRKK
jgi:hypothetical protein